MAAPIIPIIASLVPRLGARAALLRGAGAAAGRGGAGSLLAGARQAAGAVDPTAGAFAVTRMFGGVVSAGNRFAKNLGAWSEASIRSQEQFANLNSSFAHSMAQLRVGRLTRDLEIGRQTSGSFGDLVQARNQFEEAMVPIRSSLQNVENYLFARALELLTQLVETGTGGLAFLEDVVKSWGILLGYWPDLMSFLGKKQNDDNFRQLMDEAALQAKLSEEARRKGW